MVKVISYSLLEITEIKSLSTSQKKQFSYFWLEHNLLFSGLWLLKERTKMREAVGVIHSS